MTIFFTLSLLIIIVFIILWYHRDRKYLKKPIDDVVSSEMRRELNFKEDDDRFEKNLDEMKDKKRFSKEIINNWDDETES